MCFDASHPPRKFVRVLERHANGLVRFEFAVGWPDLGCELVLPAAMFEGFCKHHAVEFLTADANADNPMIHGAHDDDQH